MALKDFFSKRQKQREEKKIKKVSTNFNEQEQDLKVSHLDEKLCELWTKCEGCNELLYRSSLRSNHCVCKHCGHHHRLTAKERIDILIDSGTFIELDAGLSSKDPLNFVDLKPYKLRLEEAHQLANTNDAITSGIGKLNGQDVAIACMEFQYIGGSMGCVVGEKIARLVEKAIEMRLPVIVVSSSGGARMHEGILSLMQMAKTSAALQKLHEERLLYISILTEPTFGGVTASFSMLGDIIVAEPKARIGFAGRRVIEETIKQKLPKEFQTAEYLLENGQIDYIIERLKMKDNLSEIIRLHSQNTKKKTLIHNDNMISSVGERKQKQLAKLI